MQFASCAIDVGCGCVPREQSAGDESRCTALCCASAGAPARVLRVLRECGEPADVQRRDEDEANEKRSVQVEY